MKIAVIVYGPPGSGKGTQANLTAHTFGLIHFDTGKYAESIVHDPKNQSDHIIQKRREEFDTGKLLYPPWILKIVKEAVRKIGKTNFGIVFSGSPRTLYEARGLTPVIEKIYGKKNIFPVVLQVSPETSIERNSSRLVCDLCSGVMLATVLASANALSQCPVCGSRFRRRSLDKPEIIKVRLKEYEERTKPIFMYLEKRGYKIRKINGEQPPSEVFKKILKIIR